jgi:hypothetical protein
MKRAAERTHRMWEHFLPRGTFSATAATSSPQAMLVRPERLLGAFRASSRLREGGCGRRQIAHNVTVAKDYRTALPFDSPDDWGNDSDAKPACVTAQAERGAAAVVPSTDYRQAARNANEGPRPLGRRARGTNTHRPRARQRPPQTQKPTPPTHTKNNTECITVASEIEHTRRARQLLLKGNLLRPCGYALWIR